MTFSAQVRHSPQPAIPDAQQPPLALRKHALGSTVILALTAILLSGCTGGQQPRRIAVATGGVPGVGRQVIAKYHCGECHTIPGIRGAHGVFGPPLNAMGRRTYIAGQIPNAPDNLVHWIMEPTSLKPQTAMPDLNIPEQQARDVAAYLYSLQ